MCLRGAGPSKRPRLLLQVNILPVPGLDGGFLAFILLEALRGGKKIDANIEKNVMASGILLLFVLGIGLVVRDTLNLF
jgi:membrane-associated protease RseP (regulator of RpoE activity)